jgi:hypothetical protein
MNAFDVLESLGQPSLSIVETGCVHTKDIAEWVRLHPGSSFTCVDMNLGDLIEAHRVLELRGLAKHCTFLSQDHLKWLTKVTWLDVAFLKPDDLQSGVDEFLLAASAGAKLIVMSDYQTRASFAIRKAKEIGWQFESSGSLNILRRV